MPADPTRVNAIFLEAAGLPDEATRAAYLDRACGADAGLRQRAEALLRSHDTDGSSLGTPAAVDPDHAATRAFTPDADHADTRTGDGTTSADDEVPLGFLDPSARPDSLGRIGHYEVLQVLGRGGFGIVLRAFDEVLHRVVAVKVLSPQMAATSPARKRFLREARSSAQVRHENVVQVYEVGEHPLPYLVMEFIPGETLQQRLDRIGPLDVAEVVRVGRQVAEGLAAAHAQDLVHRDIKPGNVLLEGGAGRVKITDFGLARAADDASISQSGVIAGTPMYMAPEQAVGAKLDHRADLFSLGSVLYQMACGRPPFRANSTVAVLKRVAEDTPRDIREVVPETPQWLCDIISRLHAKNPDERFQSAREVADVLADCEAQLKENAKLKDFSRIPGGTRPAAAREPGRRTRTWAVAAALLLPVLALAVTEMTGVTHWFRSEQTTGQVPPKVDPELDTKSSPATGSFALAFDGEKSLVRIPSLTITADHPLTVEAWAAVDRPPAPDNANENLICNAASSGFFLSMPRNNGGRLAFAIRTNKPDDYCFAWEKQRVPRHLPVHLAGVYDGEKEIRFYVNGQLQSRKPARDIKPSPHPLTLGNNADRNGGFLGRMNEARISRAARYDADFTPARRWEADADTLALYHFDEGEGAVLKDSSGNGHHGQIIGATWVKADGSRINSPPTGSPGPPPPTFTNGLGMEFVLVPKGNAWLGGGKGKLGDREVVIPADFYLGRYEVTQEEWEKVMGENPSHFSRTGGGKDAVKDIPDGDLRRFPVESVSWDECQLFLAKLNRREKEAGWAYRLPKESEWEYACRGGPMADRPDGAFDFYLAGPTNTLSPGQANYNTGTWEKPAGLKRTCKVGSYEANRLGLFDMHGNVIEWLDDADAASRRLSHGGSYFDTPDKCRAAAAVTHRPSNRGAGLGVRLARVPAGAP